MFPEPADPEKCWLESDQNAVLIFDADAATVAAARRTLSADGYAVHSAETLEEAYLKNDCYRPWIVIAFGGRRGKWEDGWTFVSEVRKPDTPRHHPAAILLTQGAYDGPLPVGVGLSAELFLSKPVNPNELRLFVRRLRGDYASADAPT